MSRQFQKNKHTIAIIHYHNWTNRLKYLIIMNLQQTVRHWTIFTCLTLERRSCFITCGNILHTPSIEARGRCLIVLPEIPLILKLKPLYTINTHKCQVMRLIHIPTGRYMKYLMSALIWSHGQHMSHTHSLCEEIKRLKYIVRVREKSFQYVQCSWMTHNSVTLWRSMMRIYKQYIFHSWYIHMVV